VSQLKVSAGSLSVRLPDGRRLGYSEYGVADGSPVLFFHGAPGSAYIHADLTEIAAQRGVRLIGVDRPGYGVSEAHPGGSFLSWADDVAAFTAALGIARFSIIGFSAGTPYALACAYGFPDRVKQVGLVGALVPSVTQGMPPLVCGLYTLAQTNPDELRKTFSAVAPSAAALFDVVSSNVAEVDRKILHDRASGFESEYARALQGGIEGVASDYLLLAADQGFPVDKIAAEVHLFTGTADQNTPPAMTESFAARLPRSQVHQLQDEGHYILYTHWDEILRCVS
jgi:pimeloyl-ACP methyl ester carboxylesterase